MAKLCESAIEEMAIEELQTLGYDYIAGVDLAPDAPLPERGSYGDVLLMGRQEIEGMKYKNVAIELLKKLLSDEIKLRSKHNLAKSKSLMEMLDGAIKRYQNNLLTTAEIIEELIHIAREINAADKRGADMGLSEDELAFYDALETNDSAVKVLGNEQLRAIAREIAEKVRNNATIDFTIKETTRARIMVIVRRILNKYGYPPDKQPAAIELVMKQAENLADMWAVTNNARNVNTEGNDSGSFANVVGRDEVRKKR